MEVAQVLRSAALLPSLCNMDRLFDTVKKGTVIQLRWPLVILSCYLLLYSPGNWLSPLQTQAVLLFYLLTNATLYFVDDEHFTSPYFYGSLLLFDTVSLSLILGLSGGTTPDLYVACFFTLVLSCICNDSRGLLVITFLAPAVYGYVVLSGAAANDPSIYLRLPFPLVIAIFYGYFAQVERLKRVASEKEEQASKEHRAAEAIRLQRERLEVLHQVNSSVLANGDVQGVLDVFLEKALAHLPYAAGIVRLRNPQSGTLEATAVKGFLRKNLDPAAISLAPLDEIVEKNASLAVQNIYEDVRIQDVGLLRDEGLVALLGAPLRAGGSVTGALAFFTRWEYDFTEEERRFVATLAAQLAVVVQHALLYEQIQRQADELRDANKVKDEFLGVVSHELKTPLNIISGYAGMLSERMLGEISPLQEKALQTMLRQSKELHLTISSVLQVSCIESNLSKPDLHETNMWEFLYELKSFYDYPLGKDIELVWDIPPELPVLEVDRGKLKQILLNVINNAVKFTERGSVIVSVRYSAAKAMFEFDVEDTGSGIPPARIPVIFERFRQADSSDSRIYGGVGLGLYIVKKYVDLLHGTIDVRSKLGEGSKFTIRIPALMIRPQPPRQPVFAGPLGSESELMQER